MANEKRTPSCGRFQRGRSKDLKLVLAQSINRYKAVKLYLEDKDEFLKSLTECALIP